MKSRFLLCGTLSLAEANSNGTWPRPQQCNGTSELAHFDNLSGIPLVQTGRIPDPYKGLYFQSFNFLETIETDLAPGVIPHSGFQYAISNKLTLATQGLAEWTVDCPSSTTKPSPWKGFIVGALLTYNMGAAAAPTACNITIIVFKKGDNTAEAVEVGAQTSTHDPTTSLGPQQQAFGQFNQQFHDLEYVLLQHTVADQTGKCCAR